MKLTLCALLLALVFPVETPTASQEPHTSGLQGKVYAAEFGDLLTDINVRVLREGKVVKIARVDKESNYKISDLSAGKYEILIHEDGFVTRRFNVELKENEQRVIDIDLAIGDATNWAAGVDFGISGTVSRSSGEPIQGANVVVISPFNGNRLSEMRTDKKGRYRLPAKQGRFLIYVSRPGFIIKCASVLLHAGSPERRTTNFVLEELK